MRLCSPTRKYDCTSKVKLGPPRGHNPQLEGKKRYTPFQKPAYQELSCDIRAPSNDLAKSLTTRIPIQRSHNKVLMYSSVHQLNVYAHYIYRIALGYIGENLTIANKAPKHVVF